MLNIIQNYYNQNLKMLLGSLELQIFSNINKRIFEMIQDKRYQITKFG